MEGINCYVVSRLQDVGKINGYFFFRRFFFSNQEEQQHETALAAQICIHSDLKFHNIRIKMGIRKSAKRELDFVH